MLQQPEADDFVIATGEQHSVRDFVQRVGTQLGMSIEWRGRGVDEQGIDLLTGRTVVRVDKRYFRPTEVETLLGDASKARNRLGWHPEISFDQLVSEMVDADLAITRRDALLAREGFALLRRHE
jgi:GDPmannose 4,6-dehydratase